jgi:hypothetical protein
MQTKRFSERNVIIFTAALILFSGLIRTINYKVGLILFYISFLPYLYFRIRIIKNRWKMEWDNLEKYRFFVLIIMLVTLIFNIAGWQEADFFLLFMLMVDFLLVSNKKL